MRTALTSLAVAALLALVAAAGLDAVRGNGGRGAAPEAAPERAGPTPAGDGGASADLRAGGATGELVYGDSACRTAGLLLPELEPAAVPPRLPCPREAAPAGWDAVDPAGVVPRPDCAPGRRAAAPPCRPALLTAGDLRRAFPGGAVAATEAAWLGGARLAVIVRDAEHGLDLLAVFEDGVLVRSPSLAASELGGLAVSPRREHVAVRLGARGAYVADRDGRPALPGRFRFQLLDTRAVAWSPDDTWTALVTRGRVFLLETDPATRLVVELPLEALALEWR